MVGTVRMRNGTLVCSLLTLTLLLTSCGGRKLSDQKWSQAETGIKQVDASLHSGSYDAARTTWKPVDNLIHAAYPKLKKRDRKLADLVWYNMGIVEIGFLNKDWHLAEQGAGALPSLLVKAHQAWKQAR